MSRRAAIAIWVMAAFFAALFFGHAWARFTTFHNTTFDLAFYARMAWGMARNEWWEPIVNAHFFGLHLSWVMIPLGLLGRLFGTVPVLLLAQALAVCAVCWPLARIGARKAGPTGAWLAPLLWLLYPNLGHVCSDEFHPGNLALLPLVFALDSLDLRRARSLAVWAAVALACRADMATVTFMLGLLAFFQGPGLKKAGIGIAAFSLIYLAFFVLILVPAFGPQQGSMALHFGKWGGSAHEVAINLLSSPLRLAEHLAEPKRLLYLPKLLAPLFFLPLLAPGWLLLSIPQVAVNLLSDFPTSTDMDCHYTTLAVPALVVATVDAVGRLQRRGLTRYPAALALASALGASFLFGGMPWSRDYRASSFTSDQATASGRATMQKIPPDASVQAPYRLLPHLAERISVSREPPPERKARFVALDVSHRQRYRHRETLLRTSEEPKIRDWFARADHALVHAEPDLVLLRRGADPRSALGGRYITGAAAAGQGTPVTSCLSVIEGELGSGEVCIDFVASGPCPRDLAIRLCTTPVKSRAAEAADRLAIRLPGRRPVHRVDLLFDGLLSPVHLRAGDRVRSCHALRDREREAISDKGLFVGVLRRSGARPDPGDPWAVPVALKQAEGG